jgi:hypothetical protein
LPDPAWRYPVLLRFDVFCGVARAMRDLSDGSETTMIAVHISAVHHASVLMSGYRIMEIVDVFGKGGLTPIGVADVIILTVHNEPSKTDGHSDSA